jgi:hypothetical protein
LFILTPGKHITVHKSSENTRLKHELGGAARYARETNAFA